MALSIPMTDVAQVLRDVAANAVLPRFRNLAAAEIRAKTSPQDVVTQADLDAEATLTRRLPDLIAHSAVVGEEAAYRDAAVLDRLSGEGPVWVVDPVDGTGNFARGDATFAMIVALVWRGETVAGWILDPSTDRLAVAERGGGAWLDGAPARVDADAARLRQLQGCAYGRRGKALKGRVGRLHYLGSAAHAYLRLLDNRFQFAAYSRLMPWDHAAGILLYTEAGGQAGLIDGTRYDPTLRRGDLLLASNDALWAEIADLLKAAGAAAATG